MHHKAKVLEKYVVENFPAISGAGIFSRSNSRSNFTLVLGVVLLLRLTIFLNPFVRKYILCYVLRCVFLMGALFSNDQ